MSESQEGQVPGVRNEAAADAVVDARENALRPTGGTETPPEQEPNRTVVARQRAQISVFAGPLPPPEDLAAYNTVFPGCADRIVKMAEDQGAHRRTLERKVVESNICGERIGQISALTIAILGLLFSFLLIWSEKNWQGFSILVTDLGSLVGVFIFVKKKQSKERLERSKIAGEPVQTSQDQTP